MRNNLLDAPLGSKTLLLFYLPDTRSHIYDMVAHHDTCAHQITTWLYSLVHFRMAFLPQPS
jgi:hypothetical protein